MDMDIDFCYRADIPQDGKRRSKGFGTLVFDHRLGAKRCIDGLNGCELKGRTLFVEADKHAAKDNSTVSARSNPQQVQQRAAPAPRVFNGNSSNNVNSNVNRHGDTKIIVFNLPFSTSWQDLKDICRAYGDVTHAAVPDVNGKSKGFGTVAFSNPRDANKAIRELNNIAIGDRNITARLYIQ